ncbi:cupin domain-containing protein [Pseudokordiimonas caeni]|uniref:cupin domain-containing protein n=1 Tax=Pseudokordiimonas caeni TaxID=2997908 RepID=UPI002811497C|nr:cupin domain-containing protein [Pseudokordiimonas caeni]
MIHRKAGRLAIAAAGALFLAAPGATCMDDSVDLVAEATAGGGKLHYYPNAEQLGALFARPNAVKSVENGQTTEDLMVFISKGRQVDLGFYDATASRWDIDDYSVDEFMYFLEGGVTLTGADGTVTEVKAGDAVFIEKGWKGVWETSGYRKIYVIYQNE